MLSTTFARVLLIQLPKSTRTVAACRQFAPIPTCTNSIFTQSFCTQPPDKGGGEQHIEPTTMTPEDAMFASVGIKKDELLENFQSDHALSTFTKLRKNGWKLTRLTGEVTTHLLNNGRFTEALHFTQVLVQRDISKIPPQIYTKLLKGFVQYGQDAECLIKVEREFTSFMGLMYENGYRTDAWQQNQVHLMATLLGNHNLAVLGAGLPPEVAANQYRLKRFDTPFKLKGEDSRLRKLVAALNEARQKNVYKKEVVLKLFNDLLSDGEEVPAKIVRLVIEHAVKCRAIKEVEEILPKVRFHDNHISCLPTRKLKHKRQLVEEMRAQKTIERESHLKYLDTLVSIQECLDLGDVSSARGIADGVRQERFAEECVEFISSNQTIKMISS